MMQSFLLSSLASVCNGTLIGEDAMISAVKTDSRHLAMGDLFVALVGERFDAHDFIDDMKREQVSAVLVSKRCDTDIPQILVDDTVIALGKIGQLNRQQFTGTLTGITGSCGKTTVKEMLAGIYAMKGRVLATKGNLNNHLGVPMTLLDLSPQDEFAVIEMGASGIGEISYTTQLAQPHIVIINNASGAHLEGFGSLQGIVNTKGEIIQGLDKNGIAILNEDDPHVECWKEMAKDVQVCTFGEASTASVTAINISADAQGCCRFDVQAFGQQCPVQLGVMGRHNVGNALAAIAAALSAGMELIDIVEGLQDFDGVQGRLRPYAGIGGMQIIDDTYNANPASVMAAIDVLASQQAEKVLVLGVMAELGDTQQQAHIDVLEYAQKRNVDKVLVVGSIYKTIIKLLTKDVSQVLYFDNKDDLIRYMKMNAQPHQVALIKGSRSAGMDVIVTALTAENK
jgi:UDP-N-acetylmuramoyl-tripeptide--D-alanyl-D-alanine ligase